MDCNIRFQQHSHTCWFNALIVCIFCSHHMRNHLIDHEADDNWPKRDKPYVLKNKKNMLFDMFRDMLNYDTYSSVTPELVLLVLNWYNYEVFQYEPFYPLWHMESFYVKGILDLLKVPTNYYHLEKKNKKFTITDYECLIGANAGDDEGYAAMEEAQKNSKQSSGDYPKIIVIETHEDCDDHFIPKYKGGHFKIDFTNKFLVYNDVEYVIDSVLMGNYNHGKIKGGGHMIAGITCMDQLYIHNSALDGKEILQPYDWTQKQGFCFKESSCNVLKNASVEKKEHCYSSYQGSRIYFAVMASHCTDIKKQGPEPTNFFSKIKENKRCQQVVELKHEMFHVCARCPEGYDKGLHETSVYCKKGENDYKHAKIITRLPIADDDDHEVVYPSGSDSSNSSNSNSNSNSGSGGGRLIKVKKAPVKKAPAKAAPVKKAPPVRKARAKADV